MRTNISFEFEDKIQQTLKQAIKLYCPKIKGLHIIKETNENYVVIFDNTGEYSKEYVQGKIDEIRQLR